MVVLWWFYGGANGIILSFMFNRYYICDVIVQCLLLGINVVSTDVSSTRRPHWVIK